MAIPRTMTAAVLTAHGGPEVLVVRDDVPIPRVEPDQVLIEVGASSVNNTDINTRVGWYTKDSADGDTAWSGTSMQFPRIQGADCCGRIVAVGTDVDPARIGERVLVRTMQAPALTADGSTEITLGSEIDGGFAQFTTVRSSEAFEIRSDLSDAELATFPCSYSTAEGLLQRAGTGAERVLITGASGGVGSALVQLAVMRGATVTAIARPEHHRTLLDLGADRVLDRDARILDNLPAQSIDVVIDVVGGKAFPELLQVLRPFGRYATAGAVAGPHVDLDLRDLYLKDLTLLGCTFHPVSVFTDLLACIEQGRIHPLMAAEYPLADIHAAQERFLAKDYVGKIAVVPPPVG